MEKVNINVIWKEFEIMLCMSIHVSFHEGQMQDNQMLNLMHDVLSSNN
jgi:hypothetical protein